MPAVVAEREFVLKTVVDEPLYEQIVERARAEDRSISAEIRRALREYLERRSES